TDQLDLPLSEWFYPFPPQRNHTDDIVFAQQGYAQHRPQLSNGDRLGQVELRIGGGVWHLNDTTSQRRSSPAVFARHRQRSSAYKRLELPRCGEGRPDPHGIFFAARDECCLSVA